MFCQILNFYLKIRTLDQIYTLKFDVIKFNEKKTCLLELLNEFGYNLYDIFKKLMMKNIHLE